MIERTNSQWLADLRTTGDRQNQALADLRAILVRGLTFTLADRWAAYDPRLTELAEEVAQETLLNVLAHLHTFEGRSRFTTWAQKIAVRAAATELRRHRWRDVPLPEPEAEADTPAAELPDPAPTPESQTERRDLARLVQTLLAEALTDKQHAALHALAVRGQSVEETARQLRLNPNALYKLIHDARARLKARLAAEGLSLAQLWSVFDPPHR